MKTNLFNFQITCSIKDAQIYHAYRIGVSFKILRKDKYSNEFKFL